MTAKTEGEPMTEQERLWEFVALLDDAFVSCLVEVAALLLTDQHGFTDLDW